MTSGACVAGLRIGLIGLLRRTGGTIGGGTGGRDASRRHNTRRTSRTRGTAVNRSPFGGRSASTWGRSGGTARIAGYSTIALRRSLGVRGGDGHSRNLTIGGVARAGGNHSRGTVSHHTTATLGRESSGTRGIIKGPIDVASGHTGSSRLLHPDLIALYDLALELLSADFAALGE